MTILFDGNGGIFAERNTTTAEALVLHLPEGMTLLCNGLHLIPKDGAVQLHKGALRPGENAFSLRTENRLYPCESLYFTGKSVTPGGFSAERVLIAQHKKLCEMERSLREMKLRLEAHERKLKKNLLFS